MGIVSHCPNGHRVKVKDSLAGRQVYCPTCQATMRVPSPQAAGRTPLRQDGDGTPLRQDGDGTPSGQDGDGTPLPLARFVPLDPAVIATLPRAVPPGTARLAAASSVQPPPDAEPEAELILNETAEAAAVPWHAAIADRPDLPWRIAYPGGEASEPVDAATMQDWLAGGQAEGTELVWRADWADWRAVQDVFPEFFAGA